MTAVVRLATNDDIDAIVALWEAFIPQTSLGGTLTESPVVPAILKTNLRAILTNPRMATWIAEIDGAPQGFLYARVDFAIFNNEPFLAELAMYPGTEPTGNAGLKLLQAMEARLEAEGVTRRVVFFYSGVHEEDLISLLETMGYTLAGTVMAKGF